MKKIIWILILLIIGGGVYWYMSQEIVIDQKIGTKTYKSEGYSFDYPENWYIYKDTARNPSQDIILVNDSNNIEGDNYYDLTNKEIKHIRIRSYTDSYTEEAIKNFYAPDKIEAEKYLPNMYGDTVIWFLSKPLNPPDIKIESLNSAYVILIPETSDRQKSLIGTLKPYNKNDKDAINAIETIMSTIKYEPSATDKEVQRGYFKSN
jgi:hypothetical protein